MVCPACRHGNSVAAKFCEACGAALGEGSNERRKVVTVLFCDVVGSTALGESTDPEALRVLLARYFERMKGIVESHGGSVEKFIGDAVMAVFGVPAVHEDDALRACRAAVEMRGEFAALRIEGRIGVSSGEVVTGTDERLATGDALNVAARLQQAAQPGEVVIAETTLALVGGAVDVERVEPLALKGKSEPVSAFRLVEARAAPERRHEMAFVGRKRELALLGEAWQRTLVEQRCELVTIVGDPGLGKSRLAAEALASFETRVVSGRCLPYGTGITYWPVVEVVKQLDSLPSDLSAVAAIRSLLGESDAATSAEEIAWAFRKLLEEQAPLVVLLDDIQWGEETFLDLVEHVALLSTSASLLVVCLARPELLDSRPPWPVTVRLEPLSSEDAASLIGAGVSEGLRGRIAAAAGGNPLFIGEMRAMADEGTSDVEVPPTLKALLASRLDQLDAGERRVLERGSVEGEVFHRGAVQALGPEETQVTPRLASLVRRELIRPDRAQLVGEDGFRFRHLLVRDAAYDALPKATRAELHERFAAWLQEHGSEVVELDEILGYHLEQACNYRSELGIPRDDELAASARAHLAAAARRASIRQDYAAAVRLFERAVALVAAAQIDVGLETDLVDALFQTGRSDDALQQADALIERASIAGDEVGVLCGRIKAGLIRLLLGPTVATEPLAALLEQALPVFETARNDLALYHAYHARGELENFRAQPDAVLEAFERAADHARIAGLPYQLLEERALGRYFGATPVSDLLTWFDEQEARGGHYIPLRMFRGRALAMLGRFDEARALQAQLRAELADRAARRGLATATCRGSFDVELLAGDPAAAAEFGEEGCRLYEELGEKGLLSSAAVRLAQAYYALDRLEDAEAWAGRCVELGTSDDVYNEMVWRQVRAKILARCGEHAEAERLAREAVAIGEKTGILDPKADMYADVAEVLLLTGKPDEAAVALAQAHEYYERKGNVVSAKRTRVRLTELHESASR